MAEMVELLLPGLFNAFFGPTFWQCLASQAQSAHCCNFMPLLLANPELTLVCSLSQNQKTLCGISNTCDIFSFKVLYKFLDDSSKKYRHSVLILVLKLSLILIAILKCKSNADSDIDTDADTLISFPHHAPVCRNS